MKELGNTKSQRITNLKSLLQTRINQHKMLNNTLCEMVSKNTPVQLINSVKHDIDSILGEMENINKDLERLENTNVYTSKDGETNAEYSFYDDVKKEKDNQTLLERFSSSARTEQMPKNNNQKDFYDSIVKQTKACEFKEAEDFKNGIEYNYEEMYDNIKKYQEKSESNKNDLTKEFIEDLRNTADSRLQANRFLVDLKDPLNIPEIMVRSVSFNPNDKRLSVCIYDFVVNIDGEKHPILEMLKFAPTSFSFSIKHLKADGKVEYVEKYVGCRVMEVARDPIDYVNDDFSRIQIFISYNDVNYEASN